MIDSFDPSEACVLTPAPSFIDIGDSRRLPLPPNCIDVIITSPPYCTRIDYAVSTSAESALLGYDREHSLRALRTRMMGTTALLDQKITPQDEWGEACCRFLRAVAAHRSKASRTYYLTTFLQYFKDLSASLGEMQRVLKPGGRAVLVVQDSFYKDLHIDLPLFTTQAAENHGFVREQQYAFEVRHTMAAINARSREYRSKSQAREAAIVFSKL